MYDVIPFSIRMTEQHLVVADRRAGLEGDVFSPDDAGVRGRRVDHAGEHDRVAHQGGCVLGGEDETLAGRRDVHGLDVH